MNAQIFIHFCDQQQLSAASLVQWRVFENDELGSLHVTPLNEIETTLETVLLWSGGFYQQRSISAEQKKHLNQALPFLIEEHVAQEIEQLHLIHRPQGDNEVEVAGIDHGTMQQLLTAFDGVNIPLNHVIPVLPLLPVDSSAISVWLEGEQAYIAHGDGHKAVLHQESLAVALTGQTQDVPITLLYCDHDGSVSAEQRESVQQTLLQQGWDVQLKPLRQTFMAYCIEQFHCANGEVMDFRSNAYRCPHNSAKFRKLWWPVAASVAACFVLELLFSLGQGIYYQYQTHTLWQHNIARYLEVFPNDQQALYAQQQQQTNFAVRIPAQQRLKQLSNSGGGDEFLPMLAALTDAGGQQFSPKQLRFDGKNGQLSVVMSARNQQAFEPLLDQLRQRGFNPSLNAVKPDGERISATLQVSL